MSLSPPAAPLNAQEAVACPKVLLHEHLDGGLRPQTLLDLARDAGLALPVADAQALAQWMLRNAHSGSLEKYLQGFALTVHAMATEAACERVAFEAAEDALADGCVLAEFRMAPYLLETHGLPAEAALQAMLRGLRRSALQTGLIVCAMRHEGVDRAHRALDLALRYQTQGVVGIDLAGPEFGHPPGPFHRVFERAAEAGLGLTCHAGEADTGSRVLEAADMGATRIGHGIHIALGPDTDLCDSWMAEAKARGLHFEVCPSSNVHTGAVPDLARHPLARMAAAGLSVSVSTDNRLMSGVSVSGEWLSVQAALGLDRDWMVRSQLAAAQASFLSEAVKAQALDAINRWSVSPEPQA